jgi:GDP-L-fucose synthase
VGENPFAKEHPFAYALAGRSLHYCRREKVYRMDKSAKIYVAGHKGLVGGAICRALQAAGYMHIISRSHSELDLCDQRAVRTFFAAEKPEYVFLAAAKVGGIHANATYPAQFIYENELLQCNIIDAAYNNGCKKLLFLGSSCIYPKFAPQPMPEEALLTGSLEPTNDCYALAKISGIRMVQAYRQQYGFDGISAMPTNLYGIGDNFHPANSHVLPALMRKFHEAKQNNASSVTIWGTGNALREFLHVDDMADACLFLMKNYSDMIHINVGCQQELSIRDLAKMIADAVGFTGDIIPDTSKPDGTPRKLMDSTRLFNMGWRPKIALEDGIKSTYAWYCEQLKTHCVRSK